MAEALVIGQRNLGLPFREKLTLRSDGLSSHGKSVKWSDVRSVRIMRFQDKWSAKFPGDGSRCFFWDKMTIVTTGWKVVLDSRLTVRPDDELKYALGAFGKKIDYTISAYQINPAFAEARKIIEAYCPDKVVEKTAFAGSFDFGEWTSWVGAILVLALIGFVLALICYAARPLFG